MLHYKVQKIVMLMWQLEPLDSIITHLYHIMF